LWVKLTTTAVNGISEPHPVHSAKPPENNIGDHWTDVFSN